MKVCFRLNLLLRILGCVFVFSSFFLSFCTFYLPYPVCSPDLLYLFCFLQKIYEGYEKEKKKKLGIYKDTHHCLSIIFRGISTGFRHRKVILLEMLQTETSLSQAWKSHPPKEAVPSVCSVDFSAPWTVAPWAPLSTGFSSQEYWSRLRFLLQRVFTTQESNPHLLCLLCCRLILYCRGQIFPKPDTKLHLTLLNSYLLPFLNLFLPQDFLT